MHKSCIKKDTLAGQRCYDLYPQSSITTVAINHRATTTLSIAVTLPTVVSRVDLPALRQEWLPLRLALQRRASRSRLQKCFRLWPDRETLNPITDAEIFAGVLWASVRGQPVGPAVRDSLPAKTVFSYLLRLDCIDHSFVLCNTNFKITTTRSLADHEFSI